MVVPDQAPANVTAVATSAGIRISWNAIPPHHTGGDLLGYKVNYYTIILLLVAR